MQLLRLLPTRREEFRAANCKPSSTEGKNEGRQRKTKSLGKTAGLSLAWNPHLGYRSTRPFNPLTVWSQVELGCMSLNIKSPNTSPSISKTRGWISQLSHSLAVWSRASYLAPLSFSFLIYKVELVIPIPGLLWGSGGTMNAKSLASMPWMLALIIKTHY